MHKGLHLTENPTKALSVYQMHGLFCGVDNYRDSTIGGYTSTSDNHDLSRDCHGVGDILQLTVVALYNLENGHDEFRK